MIGWLKGTGLGWRARVVVVAATLLVGVAAVKAAPYPTKRVRWLVTYHTTSPDPSWDISVNGPALRRAAAELERDSTYYLWYPASLPQYGHDLLGAGLLFLTPALPVWDPRNADWIVAYGTQHLTPPGIRVGSVIRLAKGISLVRADRADNP